MIRVDVVFPSVNPPLKLLLVLASVVEPTLFTTSEPGLLAVSVMGPRNVVLPVPLKVNLRAPVALERTSPPLIVVSAVLLTVSVRSLEPLYVQVPAKVIG